MLYKDYGGIEWFEDKSLIFLCKCIENSIENQMKIPKFIEQILFHLTKKTPKMSIQNNKKKMRSAEEILKDYGIEV